MTVSGSMGNPMDLGMRGVRLSTAI
jgi:hypothetical protein